MSVYAIAQLWIHDPARYGRYVERFMGVMKNYQGRVLVADEHPVVVEGHTDAVGNDAYNMDLSEKRAKAVRDWLVAQHYLENATSVVQAFGKTRPAAPNTNADGTDSPAGRQKNRRVEVVIDTCK